MWRYIFLTPSRQRCIPRYETLVPRAGKQMREIIFPIGSIRCQIIRRPNLESHVFTHIRNFRQIRKSATKFLVSIIYKPIAKAAYGKRFIIFSPICGFFRRVRYFRSHPMHTYLAVSAHGFQIFSHRIPCISHRCCHGRADIIILILIIGIRYFHMIFQFTAGIRGCGQMSIFHSLSFTIVYRFAIQRLQKLIAKIQIQRIVRYCFRSSIMVSERDGRCSVHLHSLSSRDCKYCQIFYRLFFHPDFIYIIIHPVAIHISSERETERSLAFILLKTYAVFYPTLSITARHNRFTQACESFAAVFRDLHSQVRVLPRRVYVGHVPMIHEETYHRFFRIAQIHHRRNKTAVHFAIVPWIVELIETVHSIVGIDPRIIVLTHILKTEITGNAVRLPRVKIKRTTECLRHRQFVRFSHHEVFRFCTSVSGLIHGSYGIIESFLLIAAAKFLYVSFYISIFITELCQVVFHYIKLVSVITYQHGIRHIVRIKISAVCTGLRSFPRQIHSHAVVCDHSFKIPDHAGQIMPHINRS